MESSQTSQTCWICTLKHSELDDWRTGKLDAQAHQLGISGWAIPLTVDSAGKISHQTHQNKEHSLPCIASLDLHNPLSPSAEYHLIAQLQQWWKHHEALKIWNKTILVLKGYQYLSHPRFSLKRLHLATKNLTILSRDQGDVLELMKAGFDGQIQEQWKPNKNEPGNYLLNLKQAHHGMETRGCWIPLVQAVCNYEKESWEKASADAYREWLQQATAWSNIRFLDSTTSPVWIENWKGHKEWWSPSKATTKMPKKNIAGSIQKANIVEWGNPKPHHIALIIHGFYLDGLEDILKQVPAGGIKDRMPSLDLYLSTPAEQVKEAKAIISRYMWQNAYIFGVPNRGRDIAPFVLHQLPTALKNKHKYFIKIHTKRSPHLTQGKTWGQHLITSLINPDFLQSLEQILSDPAVALLAPKGSVLPGSVELRQNAEHLQILLNKQRIHGLSAIQATFIAGSMMAGKLESLKDILHLDFKLEDFEEEERQIDGTLAHAIERIISWTATSHNLKIKELTLEPNAIQGYGYKWINN